MSSSSDFSHSRRVGIIDYGMGNLRSVHNALSFANQQQERDKAFEIVICTTAKDIETCERLVVPGQGAMSDCMNQLQQSDMIPALLGAIESKKPTFGVCVGLQMLLSRSQEVSDNSDSLFVAGLNLIEGDVKRFQQPVGNSTERLKIPHMGWSRVHFTDPHHPLWTDIEQNSYFYFVHSFYANPSDLNTVAAHSCYGIDFCCAIVKGNLFATQFHPEKSGEAGLTIYRNFLNWAPLN
jgi:glutamine amidotransferase